MATLRRCVGAVATSLVVLPRYEEFVDVAKRVDAIASEVIGRKVMLVRVQSSTPKLSRCGEMGSRVILRR